METAVPFLIVAFLFGLTWLVAVGAYLSREQPPQAADDATLAAVTPGLEKARFLAQPEAGPAPAADEPELDAAVILSLERYLEEEQSYAARFVAAPSIELLHGRPSGLTAVA